MGLRSVQRRLRRRRRRSRCRAGRCAGSGLPSPPRGDHSSTAESYRAVSNVSLVSTAAAGSAAAIAGGALPAKTRVWAAVVLTWGSCIAALVGALAVLHTGQSLVLNSSQILPLTGVTMVLDPLGEVFVVVTAVVAIASTLYWLGYASQSLSTRTTSAAPPLPLVLARLCEPRPVNAHNLGRPATVRHQHAVGTGGSERGHLPRAVGAHGVGLTRARARRSSKERGDAQRCTVVRGDDPRRGGGHPLRPGAAFGSCRRPDLRCHPCPCPPPPTCGSQHGVRARCPRIRIESGGGALARMAPEGPPRGAESSFRAHVRSHGQPRYLRDRPGRRPAARRWPSLVVADGDRHGGRFRSLRSAQCGNQHRFDTLARLLEIGRA